MNDANRRNGLHKTPTGIEGFDEITGGGLPTGRPTLVCGAAGCGKTLFAAEFLVNGACQFHEPGVFVAFEETPEELATNVKALGFDLQDLTQRKQLWIDYVKVERSEFEETGEYDLEGLFVRLNYAIESIGAKRVVIDTLEVLFAALPNPAILRAELRRLFRWLKDKGVTAVITAERGAGPSFTRHGLEEYVSDCVVLLDHRVTDQVSTRRLRVVKYRGSPHGTNEYPFLIDETGFTVIPVTSMGLTHHTSNERVSSGVPALDEMLGGHGFYRGTSVLVSGTAGTGKSSLAATFANGVCQRGERCLYVAFEESPAQIMRNMRSIGIDLQRWVAQGLLQFHAVRPTALGIETHLAVIQKLVRDATPRAIVVDPITNFVSIGASIEITAMMGRLIDYFKSREMTAFFVSLTGGEQALESTIVGVSSLMDAWIILRDQELNGERNRVLHVHKARGIRHSNQVREFVLTDEGISLVDAYLGEGTVLTGSSRLAQEALDRERDNKRRLEIEAAERRLERERQMLESQMAALRVQYEAKEDELKRALAEEQSRASLQSSDHRKLKESRKTSSAPHAER
jgi:circadian clock protein KaiC